MGARILPTVVLALAVVGCSGGQADRTEAARAGTDDAQRVVVDNAGGPIWTRETAWRLEEDLRLGTAAAEGPEPEQFSDVVSVVSDSRGRIYVLDWMSQDIRVFHPDGTFSHTIGRKGRGPGEFAGAWVLTMGAGDTLWVLDDGTMRFSAFAPDGAFLESHRRSIVGYGPPRQTILYDGGYIDWIPAFPDDRFGARIFFYPVRYAPGFERADTFPPLEYTQRMVANGSMPLMDYGGSIVAAAGADGSIWFADSREYRIYRRSLEGDTTLVFSLPVTAPPLGEAEREYVRKRWARRPELRAEQLEALPETKPIVYGIVPDNAGHIYVFADVAGVPPGTFVDVFRESGEYLGRMALPMPVPLTPGRPPVVHATLEHLYVVVSDGLDVPYVSRLRIIRGR
ncbi:MAG TPA: 6-bladed beta-propeller [Longimicrobiales bacterium]